MIRRLAPALLLLAACGSGGAAAPGGQAGTIEGTVKGVPWTKVPSALWIGKPSAGAAPVILFLFETATTCAAISVFNWDKVIGQEQVLELGVTGVAARAYNIGQDAYGAYLRDNYNPDADRGAITVRSVTPGKSMSASFDLGFGPGDALKGSFEATYCPDGVEP